jgi:HD-GYP domain-containing protein (c-di-GMP phosphodiesterase class II)
VAVGRIGAHEMPDLAVLGPQALEMMRKTVGTALDPDCYDALVRAVERVPFPEAA